MTRASPGVLVLVVAGAAAMADPLPLDCFGAEPFWSLRLTREQVSLERLGDKRVVSPVETVAPALGRTAPWLVASSGATIVLREAVCSDTMSDRLYEWSAAVILNDRGEPALLDGCCRSPEAP